MDIATTEVHGQVDHLLFGDGISFVRNMDWIDTVSVVDSVFSHP